MTITGSGVIIPETPAETPAETAACGRIAHGRAVSPRWPASVRAVTSPHAEALLDALEMFEALERGDIHPASEYPDLAGDPEDRHKALERSAEAIADLTAELAAVFPACAVTAEQEAAA